MRNVIRHYVLRGEPGRPLGAGPVVDEPWVDGARLTRPPSGPLVYALDPRGVGEPATLYGDGLVPLWSEALVRAVREAGVDNLEAFPAVLREPRSGREWTEYRAVNVIGRVAGIDVERSGLDPGIQGVALSPSWFFLAERRLAWFRLFRLAESPDLVVVDERVREVVERRGVPGVVFVEPGARA